MPTNEIEIRKSGGALIGKVILNENPTRLYAQRTAGGFNLSLPVKLMLRLVGQNDPLPMISHLRGQILVGADGGSKLRLARLVGIHGSQRRGPKAPPVICAIRKLA
jgi:hypothetical protein